jgi:hypothetical protein
MLISFRAVVLWSCQEGTAERWTGRECTTRMRKKFPFRLFGVIGVVQNNLTEMLITVQVEFHEFNGETARVRPDDSAGCFDGEPAVERLQHDRCPAQGPRFEMRSLPGYSQAAHAEADVRDCPDLVRTGLDRHLGGKRYPAEPPSVNGRAFFHAQRVSCCKYSKHQILEAPAQKVSRKKCREAQSPGRKRATAFFLHRNPMFCLTCPGDSGKNVHLSAFFSILKTMLPVNPGRLFL